MLRCLISYNIHEQPHNHKCCIALVRFPQAIFSSYTYITLIISDLFSNSYCSMIALYLSWYLWTKSSWKNLEFYSMSLATSANANWGKFVSEVVCTLWSIFSDPGFFNALTLDWNWILPYDCIFLVFMKNVYYFPHLFSARAIVPHKDGITGKLRYKLRTIVKLKISTL